MFELIMFILMLIILPTKDEIHETNRILGEIRDELKKQNSNCYNSCPCKTDGE